MIEKHIKQLKQWLRTYGIKNIILRGFFTKLPILPIAENESLRRMNWQFRSRKKLTPYLKVCKSNPELEKNNPYPKTIWWIWFQGSELAPAIVKKCLESVEYYAPLMGYNLIKLDNTNLSQYISLPTTILEKWKRGKIGNANFSDICRVSLLAEYGGIWLDSTVLLTGKIDESILNAELFFFKASFLDLSVTQISSWFIAAKSAGNAFLLSIRDSIFSYWEQNQYIDDYFIFHLFTASLSECPELEEMFEEIPFYSNTYPQLLGLELGKTYNIQKVQHILEMSHIHKLTYKSLNDSDKNSVYVHLLNNAM